MSPRKVRAIIVDQDGEPVQTVEVPEDELPFQRGPGERIVVEPDKSITDATHRRDLQAGKWIKK